MSPRLRLVAAGLALAALCLPPAAVTTILLLPVWSWIEARWGVESVGHSGPADWCYELVWLGWMVVAGSGWIHLRRRRAPRASGLLDN